MQDKQKQYVIKRCRRGVTHHSSSKRLVAVSLTIEHMKRMMIPLDSLKGSVPSFAFLTNTGTPVPISRLSTGPPKHAATAIVLCPEIHNDNLSFGRYNELFRQLMSNGYLHRNNTPLRIHIHTETGRIYNDPNMGILFLKHMPTPPRHTMSFNPSKFQIEPAVIGQSV